MKIVLIVLILFHKQDHSDGSVNYCGARMCEHSNSHTFCQYPTGPSSSCVGYINAGLLPEEKARVLARLNRRRSDVAKGVRRLPTAGDMLKLRWVEELAREAQRWADQCKPPSSPEGQDICRDLYSITVGQCVASVVGEAPGLRPESMVDVWYMQSMHYRSNVSSYVPPESHHKYYGDFAQMIWSRSYMVGCGRSRFMTSWRGRLRSVERLVCNFAPHGPVSRRALWSAALPTSSCPPRSRPDDELPALCTFQHDMDESFDEDNVMSPQEHFLLNTIMEIERNDSLDHIGSIDEIYLTKVAVATIENLFLTVSPYNSVQKRDIAEKFDTDNILTANESKEVVNIEKTDKSKLVTRKYRFIGRPKAYKVEDLIDPITERAINEMIEETTNAEKYNYGDYESTTMRDMNGVTTHLILTLTTASQFQNVTEIETTLKVIEEIKSTEISTDSPTNNISINELYSYISTNSETMGLLNEIILKLNISNSLNQTSDDIFTDPETVRQLEEALDRMEHKLAEPVHSGKVRRGLRNQHDEQKVPNLNKELENNKSLDRGPMLNMVMKYLPYLKPYEKSILGDNAVNSSSDINISMCLVFILFLCMTFGIIIFNVV